MWVSKALLSTIDKMYYYGMFSSLTAYSMFEGTSIVSSSNMVLNKSFCWLFCSSLEYCFTSCIILWKYCLALAIVSFPNLGKKKPCHLQFNLTHNTNTTVFLSDYLMLKMHSFMVELVLTVLFDVFNYSDLTLNSALFFVCLFSHL